MNKRPTPRRVRLAVALVVPVALLLPIATALAKGEGGSCPAAASGWERVSFEGWWTTTVDRGFDGDLDAAIVTLAPLLGVPATEAAVHDAIVAGVAPLDRNANGALCMKALPTTPGLPSFIFAVVDYTTSAE